MISAELYESIKKGYGDVASWAVWKKAGATPKSNMGDMSIFDIKRNPNLLDTLKNDVIMIGLNFSRHVIFSEPFRNFHDQSPYANDFKIRYAFINTPFYGAYMTDIIKNTIENSSVNVRKYIKNTPGVVEKNISLFRKELQDINANKPILIAFGGDVFEILDKYIKDDEYSNLIKITHYSHHISKENYRKEVLEQISRMDDNFIV